MQPAFTNDQIQMMQDNANDVMQTLFYFFNSASLWHLIVNSLGIMITISLLALVAGRIFGLFRFYGRD